MKKTKMEKGITLIALIITIVVLLILAAVAIAAIQNENILSHANNAAVKYNGAVQNEQDILGGYLNFLNNQGGSGSQGGSTEPEVDPAEIDFMERYILGAEKTGRSLLDLMDMSTGGFKDDTSTTELDESTLVTFLNLGLNENSTKLYIYVKYNNKAYWIISNYTTMNTESVEVCYIPQGREGDVIEGGTYDGWIILTDREGLVEIVSPDVAKDDQGNALTLTLGSGDTTVTATTDLNDDDTVDGKDTAILSYNNAITTINNYCKEVMNMENVRSVGGTNNTATPYSSTNYDDWSPVTIDVASGDNQYQEDLVKMSYWGILATVQDYWFASHAVNEGVDYIYFNAYYVMNGGLTNIYYLWGVGSDNKVSAYSYAKGVRPVVINPAGI